LENPGLLRADPEPPCEIAAADRREFPFRISRARVWNHYEGLEGFLAEIELRDKRRIRSDFVRRPSQYGPLTPLEIRDEIDQFILSGEAILRSIDGLTIAEVKVWVNEIDEFGKAQLKTIQLNDLLRAPHPVGIEKIFEYYMDGSKRADYSDAEHEMANTVIAKIEALRRVREKIRD
jgi:hypothetical protein